MSTENEKKIVEFLYSEHDGGLAMTLVGLMRPRLGILKGNPLGVSKRVIKTNTAEEAGAVDTTAAAVMLLLSPGMEYTLNGAWARSWTNWRTRARPCSPSSWSH